MSDSLKILRDIGAQTIHNETHISREYVQAIIHETFDGLQSVQFMGFISILQREYSLDLSELKKKGLLHLEEEDKRQEKDKNVFITPKKKVMSAKIYVFLGIIFVAAFVYMNSVREEFTQLDNTKIQSASKSLETVTKTEKKAPVKLENNETSSAESKTLNEDTLLDVPEANKSVELKAIAEVKKEEKFEEVPVKKELAKKELVKTLKILPKRKIWAGYINIKTNQKYQKIFRKEFALDISKNWLLLFGAGTVKLEVNEKNVQFSSRQNMRFKYVDGVFSKITVDEFKSLNKGRKW